MQPDDYGLDIECFSNAQLAGMVGVAFGLLASTVGVVYAFYRAMVR